MHVLFLAVLSTASVDHLQGQSVPQYQAKPLDGESSPAFDVAAIHLHKPAPHERSHIVDSPGRFVTENVDLKSILQWAYALPASRIVGGPEWLGTERFDIEAKSEAALDIQLGHDPEAARNEKRQMVQALLANRFHLMTHTETRELPVYALRPAGSGPTFLQTKPQGSIVNRSNRHLEIQGGENTMTVLAEELAEILGRVVIDRTGIVGRYSISLKWTPEDAAPSIDATDPSIYTALQEQLGLRLDSEKAAVEVLVIDRIEMPTDN
jgi:Protein of unknown function (DUF3738).